MGTRISAAWVFTGNQLLSNQTVVIDESGLIQSLVANTEDGLGETQHVEGVLMPGLLDVHTHLCLGAGLDPFGEALAEHPASMTLRAVDALARHLDAGVTTIRDVGGLHGIDLELQRMVADGRIEGPEIFAAGKLICATGGHACMLGIEADGADAVMRAARQNLKDGARLIKVIATGGVLTSGVRPGAQQMGEEELRAAVEVAHRAGKSVAAHAQGAAGIDAALRAGVNTIEHGFWLSDEAIAALRGPDRALVPTLAALICMQRLGDALPAEIVGKIQEVGLAHIDSIRRAHQAGCTIATGTDAGTPGNPHGNIGVELAGLRDLGFSPVECWAAATVSGARALCVDDRGLIEPGRRADLIAVPKADFDSVAEDFRPTMVMRGGRRLR